MVKVTVPGEFTALCFRTVSLIRSSGGDYFRCLPLPTNKPPVNYLRSLRDRGLWVELSWDEYNELLAQHTHVA